jgi:hypothetical protein
VSSTVWVLSRSKAILEWHQIAESRFQARVALETRFALRAIVDIAELHELL